MLDAIVFQIAELLPDLLGDIGFAAEDVDPESGDFWFGPV
jgi:hypothetical protein